ncbi:MAG TPA: acyl-CoA thioesterase domain-containing protein [Solirubrobacteraceae bacterium]|nr:acyl-CoA thioesterase domain-containing protein [Solirubrobacteraceae bacterium]
MTTDADAFYLPLGDNRYEPTRATESPWDRDAQHGGPPAALLAHLIDATVGDGLRLARLSIDFLGAIPRRELAVTVQPRARAPLARGLRAGTKSGVVVR